MQKIDYQTAKRSRDGTPAGIRNAEGRLFARSPFGLAGKGQRGGPFSVNRP